MAWISTKSWMTILLPYSMRMNRRKHFELVRQLNIKPTQGFKVIALMYPNQSPNVFLMKNNDLTLNMALLYTMRTITSSIYSSYTIYIYPLNQNSEMVVSTLFLFMDLSNTWLWMLRTSRTLLTLWLSTYPTNRSIFRSQMNSKILMVLVRLYGILSLWFTMLTKTLSILTSSLTR